MRLGTPDFIGEKLREAREARGLTGTTLADLLAVSRQAVSQYEIGGQTPAPEIMDRLCSVLRLPRSFFLRKVNGSLGTLYFRSRASATKTERVRQEQRQKWRHRIVAFIARFIEFPTVRFPSFRIGDPLDLTPSEIERFAQATRRFLGVGDGPLSNVVLLLENHGAILVRTSFEAGALDAFSEWSVEDGRPYIILNSDKQSAVRSRFDAAHELAHMILHRHFQSPLNPRFFKQLEEQAHRFASSFLAPAHTFTSSFPGRVLHDLIELKKTWGMSISAIVRRAFDLGIVNRFAYRRLMTEIGKRGWRRCEPLDSELPPEEPRLLRRSIDLLLSNRIGDLRLIAQLGAGSLADVESILGLPDGHITDRTVARPTARAEKVSG
ncbi:MAG: ImmA/IrrE family metallo-endopeptidase [Planctomycetes bacterium]|nr:ImmA/IrrE family metallo-endopeptidase [Planctomycetota bacterium]